MLMLPVFFLKQKQKQGYYYNVYTFIYSIYKASYIYKAVPKESQANLDAARSFLLKCQN